MRHRYLAVALWLAVPVGLAAALIISTLSLTEPSEPVEPALVAPVVPWFLIEGASAEWQVDQRINDSWRNGSFEMLVVSVSEGEVTIVVNETDSSYNRTLPVSQLLAEQTTLAALINSLNPLTIDVSVYETELRTHEAVERSWPAILEYSEYHRVSGGNVTSARLVDLSHLILLEGESTFVHADVGVEIYDSRTLVSLGGVTTLNATETTYYPFDLPTSAFTIQLFGSGVIDGTHTEGVFRLDIDANEDSLIASVVRSDNFLYIEEEEAFELDDLIWTLNETHSLLAFQVSQGERRISFRFAIPIDSASLLGTSSIHRYGSRSRGE